MESHDRTVQREFARQAEGFRSPTSLFADQRLANWMATAVGLQETDTVLDVAGGAGHLDRALAGRARQFVVVDLTPQMLDAGRDGAQQEGAANILFARGDATGLPFVDASFDVVWSRFAFHHMPDIAPTLREMRRVCRPGGRVAVLDLVAIDDSVAAEHNRLERVRDPSHSTHFTAEGLTAAVEAAGLEVTSSETYDYKMDTEAWLDQSLTDGAARVEVLRALEAEYGGGPSTGLRPAHGENGRATIEQRWLLLATRA